MQKIGFVLPKRQNLMVGWSWTTIKPEPLGLVAQKHAALYEQRPSLLKARYDTAARFNAVADRLEAEPALAQVLFTPPDPVL